MSDLIDRQTAIAYSISGKTREIDGEKWIRVSEVRESIKMMPSAQPEVLTCGSGELVQESDSLVKDLVKDCISRQAAIRETWKEPTYSDPLNVMTEMRDRLEALPSAQPKIIYCGDCKYKDDGIDEDGIPFLKCLNCRSYGGTRINDFCSWAERRTDVTLNRC